MNSLETVLLERIDAERISEQALSDAQLWDRLSEGNEISVRGVLLYFTVPGNFGKRLEFILAMISNAIIDADENRKYLYLEFLTYLCLDLKTFPAERVLLPELGQAALEEASTRTQKVLTDISRTEVDASRKFLSFLRKEAIARFKAEGVSNEGQVASLADELTGKDLAHFVDTVSGEAEKSNLRTAARAGLEGWLRTEVGNDYAAFLNYVIWLGASFATTNPVLIKLGWDLDPDYWNTEVDAVIRSCFSRSTLREVLSGSEDGRTAAIETVNSFVTVAVVEKNCRLLRPIFLLTGGKQGYVSLQVNPRAHNDSRKMVEEAIEIHAELERRLGGVPNVVIKVPSTAAGLKAAEKITALGIGVTVTLTFSLYQALPFARVLQSSHALVSYIAIMNGRLAFPVRDELTKQGIPDGIEASRWAGIEIARKTSKTLYSPPVDGGLGVDRNKVKIMIASLRIYGDWIPDISELWGIPVITIFPNVRRTFDSSGRSIKATSVDCVTPTDAVKTMEKSEIFRQASWTGMDGESGRPDRILSLEEGDAVEVANWAPVNETLTQFIGMYKEMSGMVGKRMEAVAEASR